MSKPSIYLETSLVSYLVAPPVLEEVRAGDSQLAARRVAVIDGVAMLEISESAIQLADNLVKFHAVPQKAAQDALHIAIACANGMSYLLTWNCKHIANARMRGSIDMVCRQSGYVTPVICTPEELEE
jgi:hypothetical protein